VPARFDFAVPAGARVQAFASAHGVQRLFTNLLKRFDDPKGGVLTLGGDDISATDVHALRREVIVLDRPTLVEMTVRGYLDLAKEGVTSSEMLSALRCVGLARVMEELEFGLDTPLSSTGWPLSVAETMKLKLAGAILARPLVLILNQLFDTLPDSVLTAAVDHVQADGRSTVVFFSDREYDLGFGSYLYLEHDRQRLFSDFESFDAARRRTDRAEVAPLPVAPPRRPALTHAG
jgi:putative ABC transport system ATP-binding protein